jgi:uncharacterized protein
MNSRYKVTLLALTVLFFSITLPAMAATPATPARPANYVVDLAGIIDPAQEQGLNNYLRELEEKTTAQLIVLTIQSLDGESLEGFSIDTAEKWGLGREDKDNGVLLTVSLNDRRYRIEVGYGLEGQLPDSFVGSLGREYLAPYFKKGEYSKGITLTTLAIIGRIAKGAEVEILGMPKVRATTERTLKKPSLASTIISIIFIIILGYLFVRNPRAFMMIAFMMMMSRGRGGAWGGGGGFGGGGFGGGGGGSFGGGGGSGGW